MSNIEEEIMREMHLKIRENLIPKEINISEEAYDLLRSKTNVVRNYFPDDGPNSFMGMKIVLRPEWEGMRCELVQFDRRHR